VERTLVPGSRGRRLFFFSIPTPRDYVDAAKLALRLKSTGPPPTRRENGHVVLASRPVTSVIGISTIPRLRRFLEFSKKITFDSWNFCKKMFLINKLK
jgi:hypothetical protein